MRIPKYVQDLIGRSEYCYDTILGHCSPGYTIRIKKYSHYQHVDTFQSEILQLRAWVNRQPGGECCILSIPEHTRYKHMQYATVLIFDPVMQRIEHLIPTK